MQKSKIFQAVGLVGTLTCLILYARQPSFPTPDKIIIFLLFVFMIFKNSVELFKRFGPFVVFLLAYEMLRGLAPKLNTRVEFTWMIDMDKILGFGELPTTRLQRALWHGHVQWYDIVAYIPYILHFLLPIILGLLIWKYKDKMYWRFVTAFLVLSFAGLITYIAVPAAPPWMAHDKGYVGEPFTRISSEVWATLGIEDFPSVYNEISPNPVAALPSLHAGYATLFFIFVLRVFGWRWALLAFIQPALIYFGTVYQGEHYLIDELLGSLYALGAYSITAYAFNSPRIRNFAKRKSSWLQRLLIPKDKPTVA